MVNPLFTNTTSEPNTKMLQPVKETVNTNVNSGLGDLISGVSSVLGTAVTFGAELSATETYNETKLEAEKVILDSVAPDFDVKSRDSFNIAAKIPNRFIKNIVLTKNYTTAIAKAGGASISARDEKAINDAYIAATGSLPTKALNLQREQAAQELRKSNTSRIVNELAGYKKMGMVGTDNAILKAGRDVRISGANLSNANQAVGSGGSAGKGVFRASHLPAFNAAKKTAHKTFVPRILGLLTNFSTANATEKAGIRAELGNLMFNQKTAMTAIITAEDGGLQMTDTELDYVISDSLALFKTLGEDLGLKVGELTEEKSMEILSKNVGFAAQTMEAGIKMDVFSSPALLAIYKAKLAGGELFASVLSDRIGEATAELEKVAEENGKDPSSMLLATINKLTKGVNPKVPDPAQKAIDQKVSINILKDLNPNDEVTPEVIGNVLDAIVDGGGEVKSFANQKAVLDVMGSANGIAAIKTMQKNNSDIAIKAINFFNKNSEINVVASMEILAKELEDSGDRIQFRNGLFESKSGSRATESKAQALNEAITTRLKFNQFGPDKNTGIIDLRKMYTGTVWENMQSKVRGGSKPITTPEEIEDGDLSSLIALGFKPTTKPVTPGQAAINRAQSKLMNVRVITP